MLRGTKCVLLVARGHRVKAVALGVEGRQLRNFSIGNPFSSKPKEPKEPELTPEALDAKEMEDIKRLIDDDTVYEEPEATFFEMVDSAWDTALDYLSPVRWIHSGFYFLHDSCGVEWWLAIVLLSSVIRICSLPVQLYASRNMLRQSKYTNELQVLRNNQNQALANSSLTDKERTLVKNNFKAQIDALSKKGGFAEWKNWLSIATAVPFGVTFYTIRSLANSEDGLKTGGCLWFTNLQEADPYCALPVMTYMFILSSMEMTMAQTNPQKSKNFALQRWGGRIAGAGMVYIFSGNAAAVMLGMIVSGSVGLMPPLLVRSAAFRKWADFPTLRPPPRATMDVELKGVALVGAKIRKWMQGATFENTRLGGGVGKIAHSPAGKVRNLSEFKVKGKTTARVKDI